MAQNHTTSSTHKSATPNFEIIPAILVKTRDELLKRINLVKSYVKTVQIDVMDNEFVPNKTIGLESLHDLPSGVNYEFHWMVNNPENYIEKIKGNYLHIVHIEAKMDFNKAKQIAEKNGGKIAIAINPPTQVEKVFAYEQKVSQILVMSVNPGFSGQIYIKEVEAKVKILSARNPKLDIEIDGGINLETINLAYKAGANKLCAASAIYENADIKKAIENLCLRAKSGV
ncbi:MAG: ribulose-phosphate 3-epimerase [Candidatus Micrarchaeota archaeon]